MRESFDVAPLPSDTVSAADATPSRIRDHASGRSYVEAPFWRRLIAIGVDVLIVAMIALLGLGVLQAHYGDSALFVSWLAAKIGSVGVLGGLSGIGYSPGQLIGRVETRRRDNGRRLGWWRGMWRYLYYPFVVFAVLSFFDFGGFTFDDRAIVTRRAPVIDPETTT